MPLVWLVTFTLAASPQLVEGRALVQQLKFAEARTQLEAAKQSTTLTPEERREVSALLAHCLAAEGRLPDAEAVYAELLADDARAPPPSAGPPRLRDAFRRAKERLYPPGFASVTRQPAPQGFVGVRLLDPWERCAGGVTLFLRRDAAFAASAVLLDALGRGQAELGDASAWYAEARAADASVCAALGSAAEPFALSRVEPVGVAQPAAQAPRSRVVPWLALGATAVTGALSATFAGLGAGSLEQGRLATFASDLRAAELAARSQFSVAWGFGIGAVVAALATVALFIAW